MSGDVMMFPDTVEEFMEQYKMVDREQVYSNGIEFVPIFRMRQWFDHVKRSPDDVRDVGKWLNDVGEFGFPEIPCSVCGYKSGHYGFKYCPNCGARMKGE